MEADALSQIIRIILSNFSMALLIVSILFMMVNRVVARNIPDSEIVYRWIALLPLGVGSLYAFVMHAFFPLISATAIGWSTSPFQFEVAIANLAVGTLAVLSVAYVNFGFRLATILLAMIWLWGDAVGHLYQIIVFHNYTIGNSGSWFVTDIIIPLILLLCLIGFTRKNYYVKPF